jgi:hypothetical protein
MDDDQLRRRVAEARAAHVGTVDEQGRAPGWVVWSAASGRSRTACTGVRDVVFDEDRSQVRTGHGPQVMACLRNLAVSLLRVAGHPNIARGVRWMGPRSDRRPRVRPARHLSHPNRPPAATPRGLH